MIPVLPGEELGRFVTANSLELPAKGSVCEAGPVCPTACLRAAITQRVIV